MRKRALAPILILALLMPWLPAQRAEAETAEEQHTHTQAHICGCQCSASSVTWLAWSQTDRLPADSGHYYLTADVQLSGAANVAQGEDITICLNGYTVRAAAATRAGDISGRLTVSDCTACADSGSVVGGDVAGGAVFRVQRGGTLVLEGGRLSGGKTGGAVFLEKGTGQGCGGRLYMYGGEISGNEGEHGGGIFLEGADPGCAATAFLMYGGSVTENRASGNGGGVYAADRSVMELHSGSITGNTAAGKAPAVYLEGQWTRISAGGAVQLDGMVLEHSENVGLKVNALTAGTQIVMDAAATEIARLVSLAEGGKQDSWSCHWITANGEPVSLCGDNFVLGHYHGDVKYEAWTGGSSHSTLPTGSKHYYLANDIVRSTNAGAVTVRADVTQHMCLNGFTITHCNPAQRLYNIQGSFTLEDCSADTDAQGRYRSGSICYGGIIPSVRTYGNCFSIQRGGTMTMTDGQICGFYSEAKAYADSVPVYIQGANKTAAAVFYMEGGQIHSNRTKANGAAIRMAGDGAAENLSRICISGGRIWGNTSETGGAVTVTADALDITGGSITDNQCVNGAVQVLEEGRVLLSAAPVIADNQGGNLFLDGALLIELGTMTGGRVGVCAARVERLISTAQTADPTAFFESDDPELKLTFRENCLYLGAAHTHGLTETAEQETWTRWTETDALPTASGSYYLAKDVQLEAAVCLPENTQLRLCLNGRTVTAARGMRIMTVTKGSSLWITDCCAQCGILTGGHSSCGGAFQVLRGGFVALHNGELAGNVATEKGAAVYVQGAEGTEPGGRFELHGGRLRGNTAKQGGAVCLDGTAAAQQQSSFAMYGGSILQNCADSGGGVYACQNSQLLLAGGQIQENTATIEGGGLYLDAAVGAVWLRGAPQVTDNRVGTAGSNLYLAGELMLHTDLLEGARLSISAEIAQRPITANVVDPQTAACFCSDSIYRTIEYNGQVYLDISDEHTHCACQGNAVGCDHTQNKWQAWESTTSLPTKAGCYYLCNDVVLEQRADITAGQEVQLCLNGKTVTAADNSRIFQVTAGARLSVSDCVGTGKLTGGSRNYGGAVNINRMGVFCLYGGTLTGNTAGTTDSGLGGAIYLQAGAGEEAGGSFCMYGGAICENTAYAGGAVYAAAGEDITATPAKIGIYGGLICRNKAGAEVIDEQGKTHICGGDGGAVYIGKYSVLTMDGGAVSENLGLGAGGGICISGGDGKLSGGKLTGNESKKSGGGIYATTGASLELSGETLIAENLAGGAGGGFAVCEKARLAMTGGTVSGNIAVAGGGISVKGESQLTATGGKVCENGAAASGGGVYAENSGIVLQDCMIIGNRAEKTGAGAFCEETAVNLDEVIFRDNAAGSNGGAAYIHHGTANIVGGSYVNNTSTGYGGALYLRKATVTVRSTQLTDNYAHAGSGAAHICGGAVTMENVCYKCNATAAACGAVCATEAARLTMKGCILENNVAGTYCGGICGRADTSVQLMGSTLTGNRAAETGSALWAAAEVILCDTQISGNSTQNGSAVYLAARRAEEQTVRFFGNIRICDNEGTMPDLYMDKGVSISTIPEGFGKQTRIYLQLRTGLLTDHLLGSYYYEGENGIYTVTYGVPPEQTDPEPTKPPTEPEEAETKPTEPEPTKPPTEPEEAETKPTEPEPTKPPTEPEEAERKPTEPEAQKPEPTEAKTPITPQPYEEESGRLLYMGLIGIGAVLSYIVVLLAKRKKKAEEEEPKSE